MSSGRTLYQMRVTKIIDHTTGIRELAVKAESPGDFKFKAGQFVMLHVPHEPKVVLRAYSIASDDRKTDGFNLIFKFVENGVGSNFVWNLKENDPITFTGPFGRLFFKEPPTKQIVFLNTGSGISQHFCYLVSKRDQFPNVKFRLLFGVRNESDTYYKAELDQLQKEMNDFKYEFVLSRPSENWKGKKGYVQHFISEFNYRQIDTTFYLCGNSGMIKEVKEQLIEKDGFSKDLIFAEAFD